MKKKPTPRPPRKAVISALISKEAAASTAIDRDPRCSTFGESRANPGPHFRWIVRHKATGSLLAGFLYGGIARAYVERGATAGGWHSHEVELIDLTKQEPAP